MQSNIKPFNTNNEALEYLKSEFKFIFNLRYRYFDFSMFALLRDKVQILIKMPDLKDDVKSFLEKLEIKRDFFIKTKYMSNKDRLTVLKTFCEEFYNYLKLKVKNNELLQ